MNKVKSVTLTIVTMLILIITFSLVTTMTAKTSTQPLRKDINKLYRLDIKH